jgi:predicted solute-binding protein
MAVVKPAIAKVAEIQIRRTFDQVDEQLWLVQKEYNKAKESAKDQSPEETQNMINMYVNAIQKRFTDLREKAQEKKGNTKVHYLES